MALPTALPASLPASAVALAASAATSAAFLATSTVLSSAAPPALAAAPPTFPATSAVTSAAFSTASPVALAAAFAPPATALAASPARSFVLSHKLLIPTSFCPLQFGSFVAFRRDLSDDAVFDPTILESAVFRIVGRARLHVPVPLRRQHCSVHSVRHQGGLDGVGACLRQRQIARRIPRVVGMTADFDLRARRCVLQRFG